MMSGCGNGAVRARPKTRTRTQHSREREGAKSSRDPKKRARHVVHRSCQEGQGRQHCLFALPVVSGCACNSSMALQSLSDRRSDGPFRLSLRPRPRPRPLPPLDSSLVPYTAATCIYATARLSTFLLSTGLSLPCHWLPGMTDSRMLQLSLFPLLQVPLRSSFSTRPAADMMVMSWT